MFSRSSTVNLIRASIFKNRPIYVQFYITSRCNLACRHCNIIYSNSDVRECSLDEMQRIADNLSRIGTSIILLTGGEPFIRKDLPEIIRTFEERGIHVRMQTNGLASEEEIQKVVEYGGRDVSVSLDTLRPDVQEFINGDFPGSWHRALKAMSFFTKHLPGKESFASIGCVLQPANIDDVPDVIRFSSAISWYTSLAPVHCTDYNHPRNFRTYDRSVDFQPADYPRVEETIERVRTMRKSGFLLYDSDPYLDDIVRFIQKEPLRWRRKNRDLCDAPNLYFAILPNGEFAPCCDYRMASPFSVNLSSPDFPKVYRGKPFREKVAEITRSCPGCMYGSFPEISIAMRYLKEKMDRIKIFIASPVDKCWPVSYEAMLQTAERIREERIRK